MSEDAAPNPSAVAAIGDRLKALRSSLGFSQNDLAGLVGVSQSYLSEVERGVKANADILSGVARHFPQINPDWLLTGREPMLRRDVARAAERQSSPAAAEPDPADRFERSLPIFNALHRATLILKGIDIIAMERLDIGNVPEMKEGF